MALKPFKNRPYSKLNATLDHIEQRQQGLSNSRRKAVAAHRVCNCERHHHGCLTRDTRRKIQSAVRHQWKRLVKHWIRDLSSNQLIHQSSFPKQSDQVSESDVSGLVLPDSVSH